MTFFAKYVQLDKLVSIIRYLLYLRIIPDTERERKLRVKPDEHAAIEMPQAPSIVTWSSISDIDDFSKQN